MKHLLCALLFTMAIGHTSGQVTPVAYAPPKDPTILGTTFVDWDSLIAQPTAAGESRPVFDNPTSTLEKFEVHATTLRPGMASHPVHRHPWEEIILLREGELTVSINGSKQHANAGSMVFFASNDAHNMQNTGTGPATYYVINFYTDLVYTASDKSAAEQASPGKLASSIIDCNTLPSTPTKMGSHISVVSSPTLTFLALESHISTLNIGQSTAADIVDPGDEFLLVKSGIVEIKVNGIATRMKEGSLLYWAPNDKRMLRNLGMTPASYQVIRVISAKSPKAAGG